MLDFEIDYEQIEEDLNTISMFLHRQELGIA